MNSRLALIRQRRRLLQLTAEAERQTFAEIGGRWCVPFALADAGMTAARSLRRHPVILGLLGLLLVRVPRARIGKWASLAITIWQGYKAWTAARSRSSSAA